MDKRRESKRVPTFTREILHKQQLLKWVWLRGRVLGYSNLLTTYLQDISGVLVVKGTFIIYEYSITFIIDT